jgi:hypothetical protein
MQVGKTKKKLNSTVSAQWHVNKGDRIYKFPSESLTLAEAVSAMHPQADETAQHDLMVNFNHKCFVLHQLDTVRSCWQLQLLEDTPEREREREREREGKEEIWLYSSASKPCDWPGLWY